MKDYYLEPLAVTFTHLLFTWAPCQYRDHPHSYYLETLCEYAPSNHILHNCTTITKGPVLLYLEPLTTIFLTAIWIFGIGKSLHGVDYN